MSKTAKFGGARRAGKRTAMLQNIKFPKGIITIHIPFMADIGSYEQLHREINKIKLPKEARTVEATITCHMNLKEPELDYEIAQVTINK